MRRSRNIHGIDAHATAPPYDEEQAAGPFGDSRALAWFTR